MEVSNGYAWYVTIREWMKGISAGAWITSKEWIRREEVTSKVEDACFVIIIIIIIQYPMYIEIRVQWTI